jgi:hypothetical protein
MPGRKTKNPESGKLFGCGGAAFLKLIDSGKWRYDMPTNTLMPHDGPKVVRVTVPNPDTKRALKYLDQLWFDMIEHGYVANPITHELTRPAGVTLYESTKPIPKKLSVVPVSGDATIMSQVTLIENEFKKLKLLIRRDMPELDQHSLAATDQPDAGSVEAMSTLGSDF